ncbi:MAG: 50S ribosomal protein L29 [Elainellaceae cyanobacterium]
MPLPKVDEVRELSDQELTDQIIAVKKDLFQLRFQKATRQLEKPHQFKHLRHRLAQLMTVERERQLAAAKNPSASVDPSDEIAAEE